MQFLNDFKIKKKPQKDEYGQRKLGNYSVESLNILNWKAPQGSLSPNSWPYTE